jgi:mannitol-1-phosphate/altronate dehydrogenase
MQTLSNSFLPGMPAPVAGPSYDRTKVTAGNVHFGVGGFHREAIAAIFGIEDAWPVVCEPFEQWVLEDRFSLGRPPFEDAGVQPVDDVKWLLPVIRLNLDNGGEIHRLESLAARS